MQLKIRLLLAAICLPVLLFAQPASNLTIFSEDGEQFFLVLNGQRQNSAPQANIRIEGLTNAFYSAQITFANKALPSITKNIPVTDPENSQPADVTYKIKKDKSGQPKLRFFGMTPIAQTYQAPPEVYVMHYGQPEQVETSVTQTTVTTANGDGGASISFNGGGANMNVNVNDPGTTITQTTTTTTTYSQNNTVTREYDNPALHPSSVPACIHPMDRNSFEAAKKSITESSFDDTKLSTAKSIAGSNCLSADQVAQVCRLLSFEASKLDFAKFAYAHTTDPNNYFKVNNVFNFSSSKEELNDFVSSSR